MKFPMPSFLQFIRARLRGLALFLFIAFAQFGVAAEPVQFTFVPPADAKNPFQRDIWAEVIAPSGETVRLPAFFVGDGHFAVRARAKEAGEYRLGPVFERGADGATVALTTKLVGSDRQQVTETEKLRAVTRSPSDPTRLVYSDGVPYTPVGANLAWFPNGTNLDYYQGAFAQFQAEHLNWMRVWMCHWGETNLDWPAKEIGALNLKVAAEWDKLVATADNRGVYVQLVLQHHGQYSSTVNPNWPANPWNAANPGGFLKSPSDFFTSPKARELTQWKYRYIVARWGYSPAIVAWELFNEVHWVDAMRQDKREGDVAAWHTAMAKFIRSVDVHRHLVTTSTEDLNSPIYAAMDYYQPHLYTADIIAGARAFMRAPGELNRPVFYGEMGDDHLPLTEKQKKSGISIVPPVWASLMGQGRLPAQPWLGADLIEQGRLGELGAVAHFIEATQLDRRANLTPFSVTVDSTVRVPLVVEGVQRWQRRPPPEINLPLDGRHLAEFANIPQVFNGSPASRAAGFPERATFHLDSPREIEARAILVGMAERGTSIRISIDGQALAEKAWKAKAADAPSATHPVAVPFRVPPRKHVLVVENPAGPDWFEMGRLEFDVKVSPLTAIGQRNDEFIALWVWDRANIFSLEPSAAVGGTVNIENVPAGRWQALWWDCPRSGSSVPATFDHPGGVLQVGIPDTTRHIAVTLTKL